MAQRLKAFSANVGIRWPPASVGAATGAGNDCDKGIVDADTGAGKNKEAGKDKGIVDAATGAGKNTDAGLNGKLLRHRNARPRAGDC